MPYGHRHRPERRQGELLELRRQSRCRRSWGRYPVNDADVPGYAYDQLWLPN